MQAGAQDLSSRLEELNAIQFKEAVEKSSRTAILPIGVIEKHGPHMPLGTDVYTARELALLASEEEYTVVFPWYYFSQINEAKHQPGTIAYSPELIWAVMQETLDELHRNGFDKIIIVNGHGGNNAFLEYFCQCQLSEKRDYSLYWYQTHYDPAVVKKAESMTMHDEYDQHAGNRETSMVKAIVPNLVHPELAGTQKGVDLDRIGNNAYDLAEVCSFVEENGILEDVGIRRMIAVVKKMLSMSIDSYLSSDIQKSFDVINSDDELDNLFIRAKDNLAKAIKNGENGAEFAPDALLAAKYLERMGDHAVNIARQIIWAQTGD